jgi:hypothetical protein
MWFKQLTGFEEKSPEAVRAKLDIKDDAFISKVNQRKFTFGKLDIITLAELKEKSPTKTDAKERIRVSEIVADVQELHCQLENRNALFQAASQFNLLEMVGPHVTPEQGIDRYEQDHTQGPACAIACGAGTIYRNYFVEIDGKRGQRATKQIDCLDLIGKAFDNEALQLWTMKNGYALVTQEGILSINKQLDQLTEAERESLKGKLKVGIQWNTEVTIAPSKHLVSQIYCSALPVAYSPVEWFYWESFSRLILEATYEATFHAALINWEKNKSNLLYLTLVGGGAFGNETHWILESLQKVIHQFRNFPLDVRMVSYGEANPQLKRYFQKFSK